MAISTLGSGRVESRTTMLSTGACMTCIDAFGDNANFRAIVDGLLDAGYPDEEIGRVMGGNFMRVWQRVARTIRASSVSDG